MLRQNNDPRPPPSLVPSAASKTQPIQPQYHTILLVQLTPSKDTRTFLDYDAPEKAVVGAISLYEDRLRQFNPLQSKIQYTVEDLFEFFDGLSELACLVFDPNLQAYLPKPPEFVKKLALKILQKTAL